MRRLPIHAGALIPAAFLLAAAAALYALEVPYLSGRIVDNAHILGASTVTELEERLKAYEDSTTNQVAVLTITSLEGESLEEYSMRVVETWKLGKKDVDNGVLLLIAKDDRKLRIEVGYGLESSLTDATTSYIINSVITPHFKSGDFDEGVRAGVAAIIAAADGTLDTSSTATTSQGIEWWFPLVFLAIWFSVIGVFTFMALFSEGCIGWFLYVFLMPFQAAPIAILGTVDLWWIGFILFGAYVVGFPILKVTAAKTPWGKKLTEKFKTRSSRGGSWSSSGWSSGGGGSSGSSWSSGGSSFSGGGGSFGGGGSSGSW